MNPNKETPVVRKTRRSAVAASATPATKKLPGRQAYVLRHASKTTGLADNAPSLLTRYADMDVQDRIRLVREGVPAELIDDLGTAMHVPRIQLLDWMGLPEATIKRRIRDVQPLSRPEGEQALAMTRLIRQVQRMVDESGDSTNFDAALWLAQWLAEPNPALGGVPPGQYMDTAEGFMLISDTLARMQSGAYA